MLANSAGCSVVAAAASVAAVVQSCKVRLQNYLKGLLPL